MPLSRREFIQWMSAGAGLATFAGCAGSGGPIAGRVVVIGGGYAGATAAKYVRLWAPDIEVTLVERNVLINQEHPDFLRIQVSQPKRVRWDARLWRSLK